MKEKIEVHKIEIKIGDKTISLKPEQAKELKKILNDMFEEKTVVHEHQYWWNWPTHYYPYHPYPQWTITCGGSSSEGTSYTSANVLGSSATNTGTVSLALNAA